MARRDGLHWDRRTFLGASAVTVGAAYLGGCGGTDADARREAPPEPEPADGATLVDFDPASIPKDEARYALGVQACATSASAALLWTHVEGAAPGRVRVWRDADAAGQVKLVHDGPVEAKDGYVKVEIDGLGAGHYRYAFFSDDLSSRSALGRFRTAFAQDDLRPLTIAPMSCTNFARAPYGALEVLAEEQPDLLCHLGDLSYNDGATTLEEYRDKYRRTLQDPGYRALLPTAGLYATWDDHEVGNDFDPEKMAEEAPEQLAAATDAYFETLPIPEDPPRRLWRSYRWGKTAEIFVLDCRSERRPSTRGSDEGIYVSPEQLDWLLEGLERSDAAFKVILSSVPITRLFGLWNLALADRWEGYGAQRERLLEHIYTKVSGRTLFLAGDFHCGYVGRVEPEGPGRNVFEVCTATAARGPNPVAVLYDTGELAPEDSFPEGQFVFGTGATRHATTVTLDPLNDEVRVKVIEAREEVRGEVLFDGRIPFA